MRPHRRSAVLLAATGGLLISQFSRAADQIWRTPAGGNFSDPANWDLNVPGPADNAQFDLANATPYTVTLTGNVTNNRLLVRNDRVRFGSSGENIFTYTLTSTNNPSITVGNVAGSVGEMTLVRAHLMGRDAMVGGEAGAEGTVILNGVGSWRNTGIVTIGNQGTGTLDIRSEMNFEAAALHIGVAGTGDVIVQNSGGLVAPTIHVGDTVEGSGVMEVRTGGRVNGTYAAIARGLGVGSVLVEGTGRWTLSQGFDIGRGGIGTLEVLNGGSASAFSIALGSLEGADGSATVSGTGSQLTATGSIIVGSAGTGTLVADLGGRINTGAAILGMGVFGDGVVELSDPDTLWTLTGGLQVGGSGVGELNVAAGARVTSVTGALGGSGTGIAIINGDGSQWVMTSALEVGQAGSGTLEIAAGGLVRNTSAILGKQAASIAEVVVDGPGSAWNSSGAVQIGLGADAEALMYVQNGATATAASATIGAGGATGGLGAVFVTGPNARWAVTNDIVVGDGVAGVLDITQGGVASGRDGIIASSAGGSGLATISGPGSQWNLSRNLYVGGGIGAASGMGTLEISEGGAVNVTGGVRVWSTGTILFNEGQLTAFNVEILGGQLSGTGTFTSRLLTKPATIEVPDGGLLALTGQLTTDGGTITKTGLGTLAISGAQVHNMPATLRVSQGAVALNSDALNGTFSRLTVDIEGGGSATFNTTQHLKVLEIDNGRALMPGSGKVLVTDTPSIAAEGQLDIDANAMVVRSGNVAQVRAQLIAGRGSAGGVVSGKWDGTSGITSTAARLADATSETRVVGYALNGELLVSYQTFAGEPVGLNDVLVRYTKNGDANLDGVVNNNDITILAGFYRPGETGKHWYQADFNYDGEVNNNDITTLAGFYRPDEPPVAAAVAGLVAVPEPGMMLMALPAALLGRRRRVSCAR